MGNRREQQHIIDQKLRPPKIASYTLTIIGSETGLPTQGQGSNELCVQNKKNYVFEFILFLNGITLTSARFYKILFNS
jgi:hypothetical protein